MSEVSLGCQTTRPVNGNCGNWRPAGVSREARTFSDNLLKLRAVLILLAARRGAKTSTVTSLSRELKSYGAKASFRSLYHWRERYLRFGFAGIARRQRSDRNQPRGLSADALARIVDAATRIRRHGDVAREFRKADMGVSYETFRFWVSTFRGVCESSRRWRGRNRLGCSSRTLAMKARGTTASPRAIGALPIPDPRTWPGEIKTWYQGAVGECGPSDIFIFDAGQVAAMYLHDAVTAAAVVEEAASGWHTEDGYPALCFSPGRITEIQDRLEALGYSVHVHEPANQQTPPRGRKRAAVVDIACARGEKREQK